MGANSFPPINGPFSAERFPPRVIMDGHELGRAYDHRCGGTHPLSFSRVITMADQKASVNDQDYPLLATKLYIPEPRTDLVQRTRLVESLNTGIHRKVSLISAPAGFGKTTLLSEWIFQSHLPVAWISLDKGDNDPGYFIRYIIAALRKVEPKVGETTLALLQSPLPPPFEAIIVNLIQEIEYISGDFVLALDDYHAIDTVQTHQLVAFLIERMPPQMHFVVATRADPGLPLARWRVRNQLSEFRVSDLCFSSDETRRFLNDVMKLNLSNQDIAVLESRTEGWIAGLQLAGLSMQGCGDVPGFIKAFAGDDRLIVDYLAQEVLNLQPPHVRDFLLQTSILNRLSEPLCDCVTQQKGSQKILEDLEKANLFLIPLDNNRHWYRYHHLFADLLRQRLHQKKPDSITRLHLKACDWFEANGYTEEAIEHALTAKNFESAAHLIEAYIAAKWRGGEQVTPFKWLEQLPEEVKLDKPSLGITHARFLFESGDQEAAEKILDRIEKELVNMPTSRFDTVNEKFGLTKDAAITALQGRTAAIKAYMATRKGDILRIDRYSRQALDCLSEKDFAWRAIVAISSAIAHGIKSDSMAAIKGFNEAVAAAKAAGNVYLYLMTRVWLVNVLKIAGRLPEAIDICRQLLRELDEGKLSFYVASGHVWGTWAEMLYESNEIGEACEYAEKGIAIVEQSHDVNYLGWRYVCHVKILCSKQKPADAEKIIPKLDRLVETSMMAPWILTQVKAAKARIYLTKGDNQNLESWIRQCGLKLDDEISVLNEAEHVMYARILMVQGRLDDALGLLRRLIANAEKAGRIFHQIESLVLQAMVFKKLNNVAESMAAAQKALKLAEPGGYVRIFVDEGPAMAELLGKMLDATNNIPRAFVKKLLPALTLRKTMNTENGRVEPLSERELEVLMFIAAGRSNQKIAEALFISMSTVKTHLRNIYGKLNVHSRTEAIVKARELELL